MKPSNSISCRGLNVAMVQGHGANLPIPCRDVSAPVSSLFTLTSVVDKVVICGYWMGPESEDGWGYVEATVYKAF